jgi:hypothetical protein
VFPIDVRGLLPITRMISEPTCKHQPETPDQCLGSRSTSLIISNIFYTRSVTYKKIRGSRSTLHIAYITFNTHREGCKKQGVPDRRSIQLLLFLARAVPFTKSKGLSIDAPYNFYYFQHAYHRVQKIRGSRFSI